MMLSDMNFKKLTILSLVFLMSGVVGLITPENLFAWENPKRFREIETIGRIARRGIAALIQGDYETVGRTMTENHLMLQSIGVSSPELDNLIKAAASTSLGAKLTGAGGGRCMIALTRDPKLTSDAIELAGGRTLITKLGSVGVSIDDYEGIKEVCVIGVSDLRTGEKVKAVIVPEGSFSEENFLDLKDWCSKHMAKYKIPKIFEIRESLPKNKMGKVLWRNLK